MRPAVVYLSRWNNRNWSRPFLESIVRHPAGVDFDLIFVCKGYPEGEGNAALSELRGAVGATVVEVRIPDAGYDLNAYLNMAARFEHDRMLFLNSYSRTLAPSWLSSFLGAFQAVSSCGVVAATGSYEVIPGTTFPNINVRTNAFMISRALFLSLDAGPLTTKADCNRFEAGSLSLTRQIEERGFEPVLVDRFGKAWRAPDWPDSGVFRSRQQECLLIADNRTHHYAAGSASKRAKLARLAWGEAATAPHQPLMRRLASELVWRRPRLGAFLLNTLGWPP